MSFINTVDVVGDEQLTDSIINREITEFKDDGVQTIGKYAFRKCENLVSVELPMVAQLSSNSFSYCSSLKNINFPNVTTVPDSCFTDCITLEKADFGKARYIELMAFYGCAALKALILRSTTKANAPHSTSLAMTPISKGTGYIYVPAALVDSYKSASGWSTYADQFRAIEDYPEVCDPYSWDTVFKTIDNGTYKDVYKVGDTVPLDLSSEGVINMQIAAFDADTLADGTGTAAISWVGKELLATKHRWNPARSGSTGAYTEGTGAIGGWDKSEIRSHLSANVKKLIPALVLDKIVTVAKTHKAFDGAGSGFTQTTNDDVWIPSDNEVDAGLYSSLFPDNASRKKTQIGSTTNTQWWLRYTNTTSTAFYVNHNGYVVNDATSKVYGVCLGFCTGKTPTA